MVIKRVSPLSAAKIGGILGVVAGLLVGIFMSLWLTAIGSMMGDASERGALGFAGMLGGAATIVIAPIFYGVFCFVMGLIYAAIYNVAAKWVGGIEIETA